MSAEDDIERMYRDEAAFEGDLEDEEDRFEKGIMKVGLEKYWKMLDACSTGEDDKSEHAFQRMFGVFPYDVLDVIDNSSAEIDDYKNGNMSEAEFRRETGFPSQALIRLGEMPNYKKELIKEKEPIVEEEPRFVKTMQWIKRVDDHLFDSMESATAADRFWKRHELGIDTARDLIKQGMISLNDIGDEFRQYFEKPKNEENPKEEPKTVRMNRYLNTVDNYVFNSLGVNSAKRFATTYELDIRIASDLIDKKIITVNDIADEFRQYFETRESGEKKKGEEKRRLNPGKWESLYNRWRGGTVTPSTYGELAGEKPSVTMQRIRNKGWHAAFRSDEEPENKIDEEKNQDPVLSAIRNRIEKYQTPEGKMASWKSVMNKIKKGGNNQRIESQMNYLKIQVQKGSMSQGDYELITGEKYSPYIEEYQIQSRFRSPTFSNTRHFSSTRKLHGHKENQEPQKARTIADKIEDLHVLYKSTLNQNRGFSQEIVVRTAVNLLEKGKITPANIEYITWDELDSEEARAKIIEWNTPRLPPMAANDALIQERRAAYRDDVSSRRSINFGPINRLVQPDYGDGAQIKSPLEIKVNEEYAIMNKDGSQVGSIIIKDRKTKPHMYSGSVCMDGKTSEMVMDLFDYGIVPRGNKWKSGKYLAKIDPEKA